MNAALRHIAARCSTIEIVPLAPQYIPSALEVAREVHAHSLYRELPLDEDKLFQQLHQAGQEVPDRYFRLAVRGLQVLGGFYGCVHATFFGGDRMAKDLGWWVRRSARGGSAAALLLLDFEAWARAQGACRVCLGQTGVEDLRMTRKLFRHCGYTLTGYNVTKGL